MNEKNIVPDRPSLDFSVLGESSIRSALEDSALGRFSVTKQRIQVALESKDIAALRQFSQYFYHNSGEYRRLVDYFGNILTNDFLIVPTGEKSFKDKSFKQLLYYADNSNIKETCNIIAKAVIRDGAFYGYERDLNGIISMQQLPAAYCRSRFKVLGVYAVEFDVAFFDNYRGQELQDMLDSFPQEFAGFYSEYLKDRQNKKWHLLDPSFARAHMLEDPIPMLSPVFIDLIELEDYKRMEKRKAKLELYKLIIQKIPLNSDNELTFTIDELKEFHRNIRKLISDTEIDVVTTPCEVESVDLQDKVQNDRQLVEKATNMIYSTAGTPMALFNSFNKSGSIGLRESIRVDENVMFALLPQFERWYQNKLSTVSKVECKIIFPPITFFNRKEMVDLYEKSATQGFPTKLLTMTALGISQNLADSLLKYENDILDLHTRMIPTASSHTTPSEAPGRPESNGPLSEEGQRTKDGDKNKNRAKGGE